jgi:hypothetical protein
MPTDVAVEKLDISENQLNLGDGKCLRAPDKSFVWHPDAIRTAASFLRSERIVPNPSFTERLSTRVGKASSEVSAPNLPASILIKSIMAAYCGCRGAEITGRTEACEAPRHGIMPSGFH